MGATLPGARITVINDVYPSKGKAQGKADLLASLVAAADRQEKYQP